MLVRSQGNGPHILPTRYPQLPMTWSQQTNDPSTTRDLPAENRDLLQQRPQWNDATPSVNGGEATSLTRRTVAGDGDARWPHHPVPGTGAARTDAHITAAPRGVPGGTGTAHRQRATPEVFSPPGGSFFPGYVGRPTVDTGYDNRPTAGRRTTDRGGDPRLPAHPTTCDRPGCTQPSWNGQPGSVCSAACHDALFPSDHDDPRGAPDRHHTPRPAPVGDVHGLHMMDDQGLFAAGRAVTPHSHLTTLPPVNATRLASSRGAQGTRGMEPLASTAPAPVNGGADTYGGANNRTNTRRSKLLVRSPSATAHPGTASTENFAPSLAWTDPGPVHEGSNTPSTARSVLPSGWHRVTGRRARNNPRRPLVRTALLGTPNCPCSQHRDSRKASLG